MSTVSGALDLRTGALTLNRRRAIEVTTTVGTAACVKPLSSLASSTRVRAHRPSESVADLRPQALAKLIQCIRGQLLRVTWTSPCTECFHAARPRLVHVRDGRARASNLFNCAPARFFAERNSKQWRVRAYCNEWPTPTYTTQRIVDWTRTDRLQFSESMLRQFVG